MDTGAGGGHLEVNGVTQAANSWVHVDAADLGSIHYVGGPAAGSEALFVQAFDGTDWSANATVTVKTLAPAAAEDFNGDGNSDILWINKNGSVAEWQTDGIHVTANQSVGSVGAAWHAAGTGDFNGDGKSDILWPYHREPDCRIGRQHVARRRDRRLQSRRQGRRAVAQR
jgi:hypothetical protein